MSEKILVTGSAGFIGYHLSKKLLDKGFDVLGIDIMNDYYDVELKKMRLSKLTEYNNFQFAKSDISNKETLFELFKEYKPVYVVNLAAQAGVRYSIDEPDTYINSNIVGFYNILEACRNYPVKHLVYASSSSVYGNNKKVPFEETDFVDNPVSLYAATKKSNELMASTYSHLYDIPATGLRFFTVYGPMGRPDMAYYKFADMYFNNETINIYNNGDFENDLYRDFTYINDVVEGIICLLPVLPNNSSSNISHEIYNIGNNTPVKLMEFITSLERAFSNSLGRNVVFNKKYEAIKPGDVPKTYASTTKLNKITGFKPKTKISDGLQDFTNWYVDYHNKN